MVSRRVRYIANTFGAIACSCVWNLLLSEPVRHSGFSTGKRSALIFQKCLRISFGHSIFFSSYNRRKILHHPPRKPELNPAPHQVKLFSPRPPSTVSLRTPSLNITFYSISPPRLPTPIIDQA